ncbi:hypothetical protein L7F22_005866 [Adiantum nelumboides]|nr:hypothetical protein [Adiantum nelumboides]MCO5552355.1 hypothetical protein [Adiantum nelumboides]
MSSLRECQDGHLTKSLLPPFRELFLETQENMDSSALSCVAAPCATSHSCNVPCGKLKRPFHELHRHSLHELQRAQTDMRALNGLQPPGSHFPLSQEWSINLINTKVTEQRVPHYVKAANPVCDAALSFENEGCETANLSRADTFPCTEKARLQVGGPLNADIDMKVSAKKPPRPPKLPNTNKLGSNLTRCLSEMGTFSQREKSEKKRQSSSTSFCALLFTLCFAVIMIGQGFLSQGSQELATFSTNAASPAEEFMKTSRLAEAQEDAVTNSKNLLLNVERVKRGVQAEHLLHRVKHLDFGT